MKITNFCTCSKLFLIEIRWVAGYKTKKTNKTGGLIALLRPYVFQVFLLPPSKGRWSLVLSLNISSPIQFVNQDQQCNVKERGSSEASQSLPLSEEDKFNFPWASSSKVDCWFDYSWTCNNKDLWKVKKMGLPGFLCNNRVASKSDPNFDKEPTPQE